MPSLHYNHLDMLVALESEVPSSVSFGIQTNHEVTREKVLSIPVKNVFKIIISSQLNNQNKKEKL